MSRRKPMPQPPPNPVAWCAFHNRLMNGNYLRKRRRCLMPRPCKVLAR